MLRDRSRPPASGRASVTNRCVSLRARCVRWRYVPPGGAECGSKQSRRRHRRKSSGAARPRERSCASARKSQIYAPVCLSPFRAKKTSVVKNADATCRREVEGDALPRARCAASIRFVIVPALRRGFNTNDSAATSCRRDRDEEIAARRRRQDGGRAAARAPLRTASPGPSPAGSYESFEADADADRLADFSRRERRAARVASARWSRCTSTCRRSSAAWSTRPLRQNLTAPPRRTPRQAWRTPAPC